ncbi:MAG: putative selenate ABC transporter substrate-binding protein [Acidimicrobiales bacterium]
MATLVGAAVALTACGGGGGASGPGDETPLTIGAIPDQDPEMLQRLYGTVADYLEAQLGVPVRYRPVTDYTASVSLFRSGELDMVWFGGLTGVQARLQVDGARAILQRDIDESFHSVFIVSASTGLAPFGDVEGLEALRGRRLTFGSESSTSGRLMPQFFLQEAGVGIDDFAGEVGFSGSHDKTIDLVESGSFEVGVVNEQVWRDRVAAGEVDLDTVSAVFRTPPYHDYHWVVRPEVATRYGDGFVAKVQEAFMGLDRGDPAEAEILDLFGADRFIETSDDNYAQIEEVATQIGLVR